MSWNTDCAKFKAIWPILVPFLIVLLRFVKCRLWVAIMVRETHTYHSRLSSSNFRWSWYGNLRRNYDYLLFWSYVSRRDWTILTRKTTSSCPCTPFDVIYMAKIQQGLRKQNNRENGGNIQTLQQHHLGSFRAIKSTAPIVNAASEKGHLLQLPHPLSGTSPAYNTIVHLECIQVKRYSTWFPTFS